MADTPRARRRISLAGHQQEFGRIAAGNERLLAIDHELVAVSPRARPDRCKVGSGRRFAEADRSAHTTRGHLGQPLVLLFFGAVIQQIRRHHVRMDHEGRTGNGVSEQFLGYDHRVQEVTPRAAIFLRHRATQHARCASSQPCFVRDHVFLFPFFMVRDELTANKSRNGVTKHLMFVGKNSPW